MQCVRGYNFRNVVGITKKQPAKTLFEIYKEQKYILIYVSV